MEGGLGQARVGKQGDIFGFSFFVSLVLMVLADG